MKKDDAPVSLADLVDFSTFGSLDRAVYEVRAVVNHSGSLSSGHYTAICRRGLAWYLYNGNHVSDRDPPTERASETVYLVFLSK
jgi:ubiquitin C-terminal hydrolase